MRTVVQGGTIVNEGKTFDGTIDIPIPKHHLMRSLMLRDVSYCQASSTIMFTSVSQV